MSTIQKLINKEVEEQVIGTLMMYPKAFGDNVNQLSEDIFYTNKCKVVYKKLYKLFTLNKHIDSVAVAEELMSDKTNHGFMVADVLETMNNATQQYRLHGLIKILDGLSKRRKLVEKSGSVTRNAFDLSSNIDSIAGEAIESFSDVIYKKSDKSSFGPVLDSLREKVREYKEKEGNFIGMESGIPKLDYLLEGIQKGSFIGFAAQTSRGKTWDGLNIMMNLLKQGKSVCFITLEQSPEQLMARLAGIYSGVDDRLILKGQTPQDRKHLVKEAMDLLVSSKSTMHQETDFEEIKKILHTEALTNKPDIIFLDYIQNISSDKIYNEREKLDSIARYFQSTLMKIGIPMWCLGQIDNASTKGETSDGVLKFRGSGQIGHSMSVAIFKKSCHEYSEIVERIKAGIPLESEWLIEKNRDNSLLGKIKTYFHPVTHKLYSEEEFMKDYGMERYTREVNTLPDFKTLGDAFKGKAQAF